MDFDHMMDARRPYAEEIALILALTENKDPGAARKQLSFPLRALFGDFCLFRCKQDVPEEERVGAFLQHASGLSFDEPGAEVLSAAPVLDEWCAIHHSESVILIGYVTGHPHLRHRARARTSLVFQIHPEQGWARTWNRYYRLRTRSRLSFFEWQYDGKISPSMRIVTFDGNPTPRAGKP